MKRWFVLAALGISGCGGSELQNVSATVSAQAKCPASISPGPRAAPQASKALFASLSKLYPTLNRSGATVQGMFGLAGGLPSTIRTKRYTTGGASKACGSKVIANSWLAFVRLPNAPADASDHVVYLTRTAKGWKVWYEWNPQNPEGAVVDV
ncbi:hypothetical protein OJ998_23180 [Solirubrobacter taibaiensis]|nr:hypothetical protein [Solirubrobacter taibaiensis]